jgi:sialic acid synthase SpsE
VGDLRARAVRAARKLEETIFRLLPTGMSGPGYLVSEMEERLRTLQDAIRSRNLVNRTLKKLDLAGLTDEERKNRVFRRSLFVTQTIRKGEVFTADNTRSVRSLIAVFRPFFTTL